MKAASEGPTRWFRWRSIGAIGVICVAILSSHAGWAQPTPLKGRGPLLEFDVAPDEASKMTGVIVGYFVPGEAIAAFEFQVPRTQVELPRPGVMRVPLIVGKLPAGMTYEVRLRTVNRRQRSEWSAPSGQFKVPDDGGVAAAPAPTSRASRKSADRTTRKSAPRSAATELKDDPDLVVLLRKQFPDVDPADAAVGFRSVRDLGTALFLASNLKVPFQDVKRLTADSGNRNFRRAITALKPDVDPQAEEQKALKQSRQAFRETPPKRK